MLMKKTFSLLAFLWMMTPQWLTAQKTWELRSFEQQFLGIPVKSPDIAITEVYSEEKTNLVNAIKKISGGTAKPTLVITTFLSGCGPCWGFIRQMEKAGMAKKYPIIVLYVADEVKKLDEVRKKLVTENNLGDFHFYAYDMARGKSELIGSSAPQFFLLDKNIKLVDSHTGYSITTNEVDAAMQEIQNGKYFSGNTYYFDKLKTTKESAKYYLEKKVIDSAVELRRYYVNKDKGTNVLVKKGLYRITQTGVQSTDGLYESFYNNGDKMEKMIVEHGDVKQYQAWWSDGKLWEDYSVAGTKSYMKEWTPEGDLLAFTSFSNQQVVNKTFYQKGIAYKEIDFSQQKEGKKYLLRDGYTKVKEKVIKDLQSIIYSLELYKRWPMQINEKEWVITSKNGEDGKPDYIEIVHWDNIWKTMADSASWSADAYIRLDLFFKGPIYRLKDQYTKPTKDDKYPSVFRYRGYEYAKEDRDGYSYNFIYFTKEEKKKIVVVKKLIDLYKELNDEQDDIKDYR